ncbi:hypothetical protein HBA91_07140 [Ochrobactrum sp. MR34]|nr:hypothetical protein [Ochrobactrum sp. MR34]
MANEKTPNYHWDIPNPYGLQIVEMMKVASTFGAIDSRFKAFEDAYLSHKHSFADITDRPTTLNGYGITDAITTDQVKSEIEASQTAQQSVIDQSIQSLANNTADALALRVRVDAAQAFTLAQKSRARQNIDALGTIDRGVPNGVATLDAGGKIPSSQLPPVAISETFVVNSQASMLALVAERGDIAVRPDLNKTFILRLEPATVLANWQEILTPADGVLSVNGLTGPVINLTAGDVGAASIADIASKLDKSGGEVTGALKAKGITDTSGSLSVSSESTSHVWLRNSQGTEKALFYCVSVGEPANIRVNGTQSYVFGVDGTLTVPSKFKTPNGELTDVGNVGGTKWQAWGSYSAFDAINNRIEQRARDWAVQEGRNQTGAYMVAERYPIGCCVLATISHTNAGPGTWVGGSQISIANLRSSTSSIFNSGHVPNIGSWESLGNCTRDGAGMFKRVQ